ncbi:MAG: 3-hydroxyacyl-CoA dehydrogenase family protein [Pseudomonadota bacterium]
MTNHGINTVAVIGAGIMGSQIAEVFSMQGKCEVRLVDVNEEVVQAGIQLVGDRLDRFFVSRGRISPDEKNAILNRITGHVGIEKAVEDVDFVSEAVKEDTSLKKSIFTILDRHAPPRAVLASNTSFQNITEIASVTKRREQVVGMHFFNPVSLMKLVEVVRGAHTSPETVEISCALARTLGKEPIVCRDSSYGFLANRAYMGMVNEAVQMVWERTASPDDIDRAMKLGMGLPAGPLEVWDYAGGWALLIASEEDSMRELGPEKGRLHPLIRMMHRSGYRKIYDFWREVFSKW